jgi:hypothetical protein
MLRYSLFSFDIARTRIDGSAAVPGGQFPARRSKFPANTKYRFLISPQRGINLINLDRAAWCVPASKNAAR